MWYTLILEFFKLASSGFDLGKALAPTDKMKEATQERKKLRMSANEFEKELKKLRAWLIMHPRQSVDAIVNLKCDGYDADDIQDFKNGLYEMFPKRKHLQQ